MIARWLDEWRRIVATRFSTADVVRLVASVILAVLLWGWVTNVQDPVEAEDFAALPLQEPDAPDGFEVVGAPPSVAVEVEGPRSVVEDVEAADLEPRLDLDDVDGAGSYSVEIDVSAPDGTRIVSVEPGEVPIVLEPVVAQSFEIVPVTQNTGDGTRRVGQPVPEISEVIVSGASSRVARVNRVILPIEVGERSEAFSAPFTPIAQDAVGSRILDVEIAPDSILTAVPIFTQGKSVAVIAQVSGDPAEGYEEVGQAVVNPPEVLVAGPDPVLRDLISLLAAPITIDGATSDVTERVNLEVTPGVRVFEPVDGIVTVQVAIRQTGVEQPLPSQPVQVIGVAPGLQARVEPATLDVVVNASADVVGGLTATDIAVRVDATGLTEGTYRPQPTVAVPANVEWIRTVPETVTVTIFAGNATPPSGVGGLNPPAIPAESAPP